MRFSWSAGLEQPGGDTFKPVTAKHVPPLSPSVALQAAPVSDGPRAVSRSGIIGRTHGLGAHLRVYAIRCRPHARINCTREKYSIVRIPGTIHEMTGRQSWRAVIWGCPERARDPKRPGAVIRFVNSRSRDHECVSIRARVV